jgi:hypothetical protein
MRRHLQVRSVHRFLQILLGEWLMVVRSVRLVEAIRNPIRFILILCSPRS